MSLLLHFFGSTSSAPCFLLYFFCSMLFPFCTVLYHSCSLRLATFSCSIVFPFSHFLLSCFTFSASSVLLLLVRSIVLHLFVPLLPLTLFFPILLFFFSLPLFSFFFFSFPFSLLRLLACPSSFFQYLGSLIVHNAPFTCRVSLLLLPQCRHALPHALAHSLRLPRFLKV